MRYDDANVVYDDRKFRGYLQQILYGNQYLERGPIQERSPIQQEASTLREEIETIKGQIDRAFALNVETGQKIDHVWMKKAKMAAHMKEKRLKEIESGMDKNFSDKFVDAAKRILDPDLYKRIEDEANG